jgi:glycosyltransferase involved in cell wall biosynthesis
MRASLGIGEFSPIAGTAARLEEIKNIPMMLRALQQLLTGFPDIQLIIAGEGSKLNELKHYAVELGLSGNVLFLGQRNDLNRIYPLFDVFLLSSFTEGVSVSLLEAMSHSIPTVATDVGGNPEVVVDGKTGFLVPSNDDTAMAEKIAMLLNDRELARTLGENSRQRVQQQFSFDGMMDEYMRLYQSL